MCHIMTTTHPAAFMHATCLILEMVARCRPGSYLQVRESVYHVRVRITASINCALVGSKYRDALVVVRSEVVQVCLLVLGYSHPDRSTASCVDLLAVMIIG